MANKYNRVLVKISGEALMGEQKFGHDYEVIEAVCEDIKSLSDSGVEVCLIVGGGNIFRGTVAAAKGIERASADYMGMMATVINSLCLQHCLEKIDVQTRVLSAIPMTTICEPYVRRRARRHMEKNRVVIFAAGTGNPFFTTDTAATLRAAEMGCDALLKATLVDGVYSDDPKKNKEAVRYEQLSYKEVLTKDLRVMDSSSIALAKDNDIPIIVFSIKEKGALKKVVQGQGRFTIIKGD